jgi:hypothetical protein
MPSAIEEPTRRVADVRQRASKLPVAALLLVPGALTVSLAFQSGGYGTRATAVAATEMLVLFAVWLILAPRPLAALSGPLLLGVIALAGLSAWEALSATWSPDPERASPEAVRTMLYAVTVALFGLMAATPRRVRMLVLGGAAGAVAVSMAALASRLLPDLFSRSAGVYLDRLSYPISYWNGLGLLAAIGGVLCLHLTSDSNEPAWIRRLAAGALPLLAATLYATLSRGATVAALVGVALYLLVARPPTLLAVFAAVGLPTAGALVLAHAASSARFTTVAPDSATVADARWIALGLVTCALAAGALRGVADRMIGHRSGQRRGNRPRVGIERFSVSVVAVCLVAGAVAALVIVSRERERSRHGTATLGASRLVDTGSSGRSAYWRVALDVAADHPLRGEGAGTFDLAWARRRDTARLMVRDAHSLYLETLAELGVVSLALLLAALGTMALAMMRRVRRGSVEAAVWAALLAAYAAWLVHAAADWDWELPAVSLWVFAAGGAALSGQPGAAAQGDPPPRQVLLRWALVAGCVLAGFQAGRLALAAGRADDALAAARGRDCPKAEVRANDSLRLRDQSTPYVVLAWCRRAAQPVAARKAMVKAIRRDRKDWRLHYDFAIVLAEGGEDPLPEAKTAHHLNPLDPDVIEAVAVFARGTRESRRGYARGKQFMVP